MPKQLLTVFLLVCPALAWAQDMFPQNGVRDERPNHYAFTNATIVIDPQTTLQNATLVVRGGRVVAVGNEW